MTSMAGYPDSTSPRLIWGETRNACPANAEEVVPLAAPVARWPTLAGCESETPLTAADVMNNGHGLMELLVERVGGPVRPNRITSCRIRC